MNIKELFQKKSVRNTVLSILVIAFVLFGSYLTYKKFFVNNYLQEASKIGLDFKPGKMSIAPIVSDSSGVELNSGFKINCENKVDATVLKEMLKVSPMQTYKIDAASGKEFVLTFDAKMYKNMVYKFEIANNQGIVSNSWAFQTQKDFKVVRTLPRNQATYVPVNTGVEVTLSHSNVEDFGKYFEILPQTKGRFETHGKVFVFVPDQLTEGTIYTVKIKKGLAIKDSEDKFEDDYVFKFQTDVKDNEKKYDYFDFAKRINNFSSKTTPYLEVNTNSERSDAQLSIDVYKYKDSKSFISNLKRYDETPRWAYFGNSQISFDTSNLDKVLTIATKIQKYKKFYWEPSFVTLPEPLKEGHYLIVANKDDKQYKTHVQISDTISYIMNAENKTVVWINDAITGKSLKNAKILTEDSISCETGDDGIGIIEGKRQAPKESERTYYTVSVKDRADLICDIESSNEYFANEQGSALKTKYWSYLYTDREMYLPNDTVRYWGIIKSRGDKPDYKEAIMRISTWGQSGELNTIDTREIKISETGSFIGDFQLPNLGSGNYYLSVLLDEKVLIEKNIEISKYTKPAYNIDVTTDKKIVSFGDDIKFDINTSFFEGTPVAGISLNYRIDNYYISYGNAQIDGELKSDNKGNSSVSLGNRLKKDAFSKSWVPKTFNFSVNNKLAEETEISAYKEFTVFPSDLMVKVASRKEGDIGVVEIKTNKIEISNTKDSIYPQEEDYRGAQIDVKLKAKVYENSWVAKQTGTYYDFINKTTTKTYDYTEVKKLIKEIDFTTGNGQYKFDVTLKPEKSYYVVVEGVDSKGFEISQTEYIYNYNWIGMQNSQKNYSFEFENNKTSFKPGEKVSVKINESGPKNDGDKGKLNINGSKNQEKGSILAENLNKTSEDDSKIEGNQKLQTLYLLMKDGVSTYFVGQGRDATNYEFEFKKEHIPNVYLTAICFDGKNLYTTESMMLRYDYKDKELKIGIKTDKEDYRPGDEVTAVVEAKDNNDIVVPGCEVNLSVVDEAFFAMSGQSVDVLENLYTYCFPTGQNLSFLSHVAFGEFHGGAECGEGGNMSKVRADFKDTAYFGALTTDESGKATFKFKLPDNITSWRTTYQGITNDLRAGNGKANIKVSQPFFVNLIFKDIFLVGDKPNITIRSFGTALTNNDNIQYSIILESPDGTKKEFTATSGGNDFCSIPLDKLQEGVYHLYATGKLGSHVDTVRRDFNVVGSLLEAARVSYYKLGADMSIEPSKSITELAFYNEENVELYNVLTSMIYEWGERIDQRLSRKVASKLFEKYFGKKEYFIPDEFDVKNYQISDGGIALLTYDSSNPEISAKACSIDSESFDKFSMRGYFYSILDDKKRPDEDLSSAFWGLGALGEPVIIDIINYMTQPNLSDKVRLRLCLALAEAGDYESSNKYYAQIIGNDKIKTSNYHAWFDMANRDEILEMTALCGAVASKLNLPQKVAFFKYVNDNSSNEILLNFEKLYFVKNSAPNMQQEGKFAYEIDGKKQDVIIKNDSKFTLSLTPEKLSKIKFLNISGNITVAATSTVPVKDSIDEKNKTLGLSRKYNGIIPKNATFKRSDLVQIKLEPTFNESSPDGYYEVVDVLPAGFIYCKSITEEIERWYLGINDGQKVSFGYHYQRGKKQKPIVYYARAVAGGEYWADSAIIKYSKSDVSGFCDKVAILVGDR